jgi:hypothetical protein
MTGDIMPQRVRVPSSSLVRELPDGEAVVLNMETEVYFGLNSSARRMWNALQSSDTIEAAFEELSGEFDVDQSVLRTDFEALVAELVELGLLTVGE